MHQTPQHRQLFEILDLTFPMLEHCQHLAVLEQFIFLKNQEYLFS